MKMRPFRLFAYIASFGVLSVFAEVRIEGTLDEIKGIVDPASRDVITLEAQYSEPVVIESAHVHLEIKSKKSKLAAAVENNASLEKAIRIQLKRVGIDAAAITSESFASTPEYGWFGSSASSYEVVNKLKVRILSNQQFVEVAKVVDREEGVAYIKLVPEFNFDEKMKVAAENQVIALLKAKAENYEERLEVGLKLKSFNIQANSSQPDFNPIIRKASRDRKSMLSASSFMEAETTYGGLAIGGYKVHARISAQYVIEAE